MSEAQGAGLDPLADWLAGLTFEALPAEVRHAGKRCLLDTIGVAVAGAERAPLAKVAKLAEAMGAGPCGVLPIGAAGRTASGAAMINGTAAHLLDFDDTVFEGILHGSAAVWPAAQAACELVGASGEALLTAFVTGSEAAYAMGALIGNGAYEDGWWGSSLLGLFGATAGAAKAFALSPQQSRQALRMAAAQSFGLRGVFGSDAKPFVLGRTAQSGVELALAARAGLEATAACFEGAAGFLQVVNRGRDTRPAFEQLGDGFRLVRPGVAVKSHPVCSAAQAAVEGTLDLMTEQGLDDAAVARAEVRATPLVCLQLRYGIPQTIMEGQFSMPFAVGTALAYGALGSAELDPSRLDDPALQAAMAKVSLVADESLAARLDDPTAAPEAAKVVLHLKDGRSCERFVPVARGMPSRPLSDEGLQAKFFDNCVPVLGEVASRALFERIWRLESLETAGALLDPAARPR